MTCQFLPSCRGRLASASKKALPPLISFGVGADGHFQQALRCQEVGPPFERWAIVDRDVQFAAELSCYEPSLV